MVQSIMSRAWRGVGVAITAMAAALMFIAMTPQAASALPSYAYCTSCHSAGSGVTVSVVKTAETATQATYAISGSTANSGGEGWGVFSSSQAKLASGSGAGSFVLPRSGLTYTVVWVDRGSGNTGSVSTTVTPLPAPPAPAAPSLTGITPTSGLNNAPVQITINGANFAAIPIVRLGTTALSGVTFVNSTRLTASVPAGLAGGIYGITVTNADGQTATMANAYTVTIPAPPVPAAPSLLSVSPTGGLNSGAVIIVIRGANFVVTPVVRLGSTNLSGVSYVDASTLTATIPAGLPAGVYDITVTNPDGQIAALSGVFTVTVPAPTPPPVVTPPRPGRDDDRDHARKDNEHRRKDRRGKDRRDGDRRSAHNDD